jgi:caffeoyl-CoA O-methyltransferase
VLTSFEIDEARWQQATDFVDRAPWGNDVEAKLILGDARTSFSAHVESLDFAFVDASKDEYGSYLDLVLDRMVPGGVIVVDNALMGGSVARDTPDPRWQPSEIASQREINERLMNDPRLRSSVLPVGDGVLVAWVRNDLSA